MRCRILNVGPDEGVRRLITEALQADRVASVQHVETGAVALEILRSLPESKLPQIVVSPFHLPILKASDFISEMRSHPHLQSIPILIWGTAISPEEINRIPATGAV